MSVDGPPASGSFPQAPRAPSLVGQILDGRYRIIKLIGEGGMGEVYAAEHVHIEKRYAIKLLKAEIVSNAEAVSRFRQEARSSSSIGHRNIIAIEDFGQLPDGRIYMCMELLNGAALNDMITQPMPVDRLLNILIQTGHGLAAAHAKGIIHRDMKPENIFVTIGPQGEDVPKLLDFGIAKVSGNDGQNHLTRTGTIFGTPFYMAPEQALGNPVDARTDIYAVGVIMYECFSGSLPFQGESFMGILTQHITTEPEPVAQRAAKAGRQLPMGLAEIITRCMQKNPAQRFATMDDLVNSLIQVYRGVAGPGMSTYMEAFPVGSAAHSVQPTPQPLVPHQSGGSRPVPSGMIGASSSGSGLYDASSSAVAPRKSKTGLIVAILVVLLAGGGITALVLLGGGGGGTGKGSGSQVAIAASGDDGSAHITQPDKGSAAVTNPPDKGSATTNPPDKGSATLPPDKGSDSGSAGSAGSATLPATEPVEVLVMTKPYVATFEIWSNGKKVIDGPDNVQVTPGAATAFTIKAKGFKDQPFTLDGVKKKVTVALSLKPGSTHVNVPPPPPPPGHPDCSATIKDPKDKHCISQYCAAHADDARCDAI